MFSVGEAGTEIDAEANEAQVPLLTLCRSAFTVHLSVHNLSVNNLAHLAAC